MLSRVNWSSYDVSGAQTDVVLVHSTTTMLQERASGGEQRVAEGRRVLLASRACLFLLTNDVDSCIHGGSFSDPRNTRDMPSYSKDGRDLSYSVLVVPAPPTCVQDPQNGCSTRSCDAANTKWAKMWPQGLERC